MVSVAKKYLVKLDTEGAQIRKIELVPVFIGNTAKELIFNFEWNYLENNGRANC